MQDQVRVEESGDFQCPLYTFPVRPSNEKRTESRFSGHLDPQRFPGASRSNMAVDTTLVIGKHTRPRGTIILPVCHKNKSKNSCTKLY